MQYIRCSDAEPGIDSMAAELTRHVTDERRVLWLLSGGSNIPIEKEIMARLSADVQASLTVMLVDERYGPPGHADSNWEQLLAAGFEPGRTSVVAVLTEGQAFGEAAAQYDQRAREAFKQADIIIAQLGIGADGHTAGILPGSPATVDSTEYVIAYETAPYRRLSLSFHALEQCAAAYVFAFGADKRAPLESLLTERPLAEQPAQILKHIPRAYVYNDQVEEQA